MKPRSRVGAVKGLGIHTGVQRAVAPGVVGPACDPWVVRNQGTKGRLMTTPTDERQPNGLVSRRASGARLPVPAPSPIAGLEPLTRRTFRRLAWLSLRNATASRSIMAGLGLVAVALALGSLLVADLVNAPEPIAVAALTTPIGLVSFVFVVWIFLAREFQRWRRGGGWVVGYFTAQSSQLVHPEDGDWVLTDHYTAHRGGGEAGPFRRRVFAHLAVEADLHRVEIRFDTKVPRLVEIYLRDMPGLELIDTRRVGLGNVYFLRRLPRSMEASPWTSEFVAGPSVSVTGGSTPGVGRR